MARFVHEQSAARYYCMLSTLQPVKTLLDILHFGEFLGAFRHSPLAFQQICQQKSWLFGWEGIKIVQKVVAISTNSCCQTNLEQLSCYG